MVHLSTLGAFGYASHPHLDDKLDHLLTLCLPVIFVVCLIYGIGGFTVFLIDFEA
jgi:hypothetical protein